MQAVSTSQIADLLHFNNNAQYRMFAIGLLIISYQFIFLKIKLGAFFSAGKKTQQSLT